MLLLVVAAVVTVATEGLCNITMANTSTVWWHVVNSSSESLFLSNHTHYILNGTLCNVSASMIAPVVDELGNTPSPPCSLDYSVYLTNVTVVVKGGAVLPRLSIAACEQGCMSGRVENVTIIVDGVVMRSDVVAPPPALISTQECSSFLPFSLTSLNVTIRNSVVYATTSSTEIALILLQVNSSGVTVVITNTTLMLHNIVLAVFSFTKSGDSSTSSSHGTAPQFADISIVIAEQSNIHLLVDTPSTSTLSTTFWYCRGLIVVCLNCLRNVPFGDARAVLRGLVVNVSCTRVNVTVVAQRNASSPFTSGWSYDVQETQFMALVELTAQVTSIKSVRVTVINSSILAYIRQSAGIQQRCGRPENIVGDD